MFSVSDSQSTSTGVAPKIGDDLCRRGERHGRHDHFVARFHTEGLQRQVQAGSGGIDRNGVLGADESGKVVLERLHLHSSGNPTGAQRLFDRADFFLADVRKMKRQERASMTASGCWSLRRFNFHV